VLIKQKVAWFLKFKENLTEGATDALTLNIKPWINM